MFVHEGGKKLKAQKPETHESDPVWFSGFWPNCTGPVVMGYYCYYQTIVHVFSHVRAWGWIVPGMPYASTDPNDCTELAVNIAQ